MGRWVVLAAAALAAVALAIVFLVRAFSGTPVQLGASPNTAKANGKIAFLRGQTVPGGGNTQIYTMNPNGSGVVRLGGGALAERIAWSPDGRRIAFSRSLGEGGPAYLYVMNADGSNRRQLTRGSFDDGSPSWSPDGRQIVFSRARGDPQNIQGYDLYVINADGTGLRRLTQGTGQQIDSGPAWSPDGRRIAFSRNHDLYVMNAHGSDAHPIVRCTAHAQTEPGCFAAYGLSWSPDGTQIVFVYDHDPHYRLDIVNVDGSGLRPIFDCRGECLGAVAPSWSPDGTRIAFTYIARSGATHYVATISSSGIGLRRLAGPGDCCPAWQPVPIIRTNPSDAAALGSSTTPGPGEPGYNPCPTFPCPWFDTFKVTYRLSDGSLVAMNAY